MRRRTLAVVGAALGAVLTLSACGTGGQTTAVNRSDPAGSSVSRPASATGSNAQDMQDIYALKRQLAAFRMAQAEVSGGGCSSLDQ
jgi:hypothetical protein